MVAGMVMPLDNLKAIYEHLFRDGVMVAKKDKRPQTKHPEIPGVDNLQVIRAMGSLKSRGYVRETFAWRHYYWYLTNEGIVYLRDYLHLPPEIVPTPLQRVRRPAATLAIARRAERVQAVQGPISYVPKPGKMDAEMQEAFLDRQEYRRKTASMDEADMTESSERTPRFRGRPMAGTQIRPKGSWESKEQPMRSDAREYTREMEPSVRRKVGMHSASHIPPVEMHHAKPVEQEKMAELKECTKTAFIQKTKKVHVSPDVPTITSKVGATAAESSLFAVHSEAVKEKPKQEVSIKVSHETAAGQSKTAKDARHPTPSKPKVEKTQKTLVTKNVQDVPAVSSAEGTIAVESSVFSVHTEAVKEKPKEEEFVKVFQQTTSTVIGDSKIAKDAPRPTPSKPKEEKTQKTTMVKNVQDVLATVEATSGKSSVSSVPTEAAKEKPKAEVFSKVSTKTTSTVADKSNTAKDAPHPTPSEPKVEKTQLTLVATNAQNVASVSSAVKTAAAETSTEAVKEKPKEEVCIKVSQTAPKTDKDSQTDDTSHPAPSKPKAEKTQKTTKTKNVQDISIVSSTVGAAAVQSAIFPVIAEEKPKEEVSVIVSQETTSKRDSKTDKDAARPTLSKPRVEKSQQATVTKNVQDVPIVSSAVETAQVKDKPKEEVCISQTTPTGDSKMDKDASHLTGSKAKVEKTQKTTKTKTVQAIPTVSSTAVESTVFSLSAEAVKEKPKEEVFMKISQETTFIGTDDTKIAKDAPHPTPTKPKAEKIQKTQVTKNVQDLPAVISAVETTAVKSSVSTEAVKEKSKEELCVSASQEITPKGDSKEDKDAPHPAPAQPKVEKVQKTTKTKTVQDIPNITSTTVESSVFSVSAEAANKKPKEEVFMKVSQETTFTGTDESKTTKDAPHPTLSKPNVEKTKTVQEVPAVSSAVETTAVKCSISTEAVKEKPKEEVCVSVSQETTSKGDSKVDRDAPRPTPSQPKVEKIQKTTKTKTVQEIPNVLSVVEAAAVESSVISVSTEAVKEKPKEEVFIKVSQETTFTGTDESKTTKAAPHLTPSKPKADKTQKTKTVQDVPAVSSAVETTAVKSSVSTEAVKEKPKEEVCVSVSQETTSKDDGKEDNDAPHPILSKPKVEKVQKTTKTKNVQDIPSMGTPAVQSSVVSVSSESVKENPTEEVCTHVSIETTSTSDSKMHKDPSSSKPKVEKTEKTVLTKNVQEQPIKDKKAGVTNETSIAPHDVPVVPADETNSSTSIGTQVPVKSLESATPLDSQKTKDPQEASKDDNIKVHETLEIPCAISAAEVKAEVKGQKPELNPESQTPSTATEVKITTDSSKTSEVVAQTPKKLGSNIDSDSVQQKPSPAKLAEEPAVTAAKDRDTENASKTSKGKKKKQKSASKTSAVKQVPPPTAETKVIEVKTENASQVDPLKVESPEQVTTNDSAKTSPEGMHAVESMQPTAVQNEAPAHKGEVEPAQPSAEKREVLKGKTSSSQRQWEAPAASASAAAAASAQLTPLPKQGEPPSVAQHTPAPDTQQSAEKQNRLSDSKAPVITGPLPADENTCDEETQSIDDAMRKKIVVVEEVIEVQQIASPVAGQPVTPPVTEIAGDDLDYDVLEELAIERGLLPSPAEETCWDHSLQEPEDKTFPNFIEDERDRVQKKTFTKWVNKHLIKHQRAETQRHVNDLYEDLRDGHNLISLLEVLSGETLPRERGRMRFHKLQNVQIALDFLRHRQVKLVNIRNDDIADGNPKLTLGLIWTIILHFQVSYSISDIQVNGQSDDMSAKEKLLLWSQRMVEGYHGIRCDNFTTSWRDGKLFNAVIHKHEPRLVDMGKVYRQTNLENLEQAFSVAERELGVTRLLDPEDVDVPHPDEKSIITYVSSLYDAMPRIPDVQDGVKASDLELRWQEYYELVTVLLQWIRHHILIFEERKFPSSYEEVELLWRQFLKFKETELPPKESDKSHSTHLYQSFESAVHAGQVKVPPGYHPIDVEKEWGRLHVAILERERLLRIEFERLERLQQIVSKVQMESGMCEEQLNQTESLLQTDIRLLSAGKPAQHTVEVERDLDKADGMIRLLFNDVQLLKDGRHLQAEQMYRRVYRLHERLVNLRSDYNLRLKSSISTASHVSITHISQKPVQRVRPELDEVTLRYAQDLLAWVEENQRRIDTAEWGIDLPSVESQLGSHRGLHQTIEDFKAKIERARADENQLSPTSKGTYRDYLGKLDLQYNKLLNSSKSRMRNLDQLYNFVSAATKELMWLNDKEEEEVNYDWSERNTNMAAKKENYSGLMRELELREKKINDIQATGDRLIKDGHPGKKTVEAFTAALQTQWSWILQVCCCIETHLKENTAYFQFFADVRDAEERIKKMQETMKKKYMCDRTTTATRLEDLLQDAVEEREQLNEFKSDIASLNKRAKSIIQLKPRDPTTPFKGKLPIQAVCDFKQMEITMHKGDECALINNSQPFKWKVLNRSGNEAIVPSICFLVPPVNKEAVDGVSSLEASHQQTLTLWQKLHVDLRSLLSWQYLMKDINLIRSWNITMFKTMKPDEYQLMLRNLQLHYQDFLKDSQDSKLFDISENMQIERDYKETTQHYDNLIRTLEKGAAVRAQGEQDESTCKSYITQIKNLRLQIEDCESRTVARIRQPVDKDPLRDCIQKTADQRKVQMELDGIKKNLDRVSQKAEEILSSPEQSSTPVLRSELDITLQKMDQTYNLSSVYLEKLKTIEIVIRNTQGAEDVVKKYENRLREVHTVPTNVHEVDNYCSELKRMRSEAENQRPVFDDMESELAKATAVSQRMVQIHTERDAELDHYRQLLGSLQDRWRAVFAQIDLRQRELEQLGRQLGYYRESYDWLIRWIADAKQRQEKIQAVPIIDSKTLKEQLAQEKKLLEEIEKNKEKVDECQKYAKAYIDTIKDYELQLVAYKAQVEPLTSPLKKTKMESASDNIIQEYVTLRTRYSELMTLTSQYIKFITDTQRRIEEEEMANAQQEQIKQEKTILQQTFMSEKEMLLKKEKQIEDEKKRLESQFEEEVRKSKALKDEQERQRKQMEDEKMKLKATMDAALIKQKEAEQEMLNKQREMQELERKRLEQERILADENQKLREKLQELEVAQKITQEIHIQTECKKVLNGQSISEEVDSFSPLSFDGIREKVPASRLYEVGLLSKMDYDKLQSGDTTIEELSKSDKLKTVLKGKNCIGGLLVHPNQKMPIYQAVKEKKIAPGTGLVLLEAQAASGYIIDPVKNKKLSVNEAVKEGLIGPELHNKMLSAERAVTGYKDPYTEAKISLFEAMKKGLIGEDHAIRLLEAQIATGGIIDPVNSHRVPNEVAYKQGQFDAATNKALQNPTDDVKGFYDPNTQENLMYQQLIERCVTDPGTGLLLLPISEEAAQNARIFTDEETRDVFDKTTVSVPFGRFKGKTVTIWEIINSEYFSDDQRKDLIRQYKTGKITVEKIIKIVLSVAEEKEKKNELAFDGLRAPVPAAKLLESKVIDKDLYNKLQKGQLLVKDVSEMEHVRNALKGTNCIAGVLIDSTKQTMSFYDAMKRDMMRPGPALHLLEAQAATGYVVDPVKNQKLTVDEAVKAGVVGPELHEKLLSAERAVTGYKDPYTGKTVSLFEAMKKDLIMKDQGIRLLDAQLATGGIIDPVQSHRIPHDIACMKGCFDDATRKFLSSPTDEVKGYFDPNTQEYITYPQLYKRCVTDKKTGLQLLPLSEQAINAKEEMKYTDAQTKDAMTQATVEVQSGPFKGRKLTLWELIHSDYLTEEQRLDLIKQYRSGKISIEKIIKIVMEIVTKKDAKKQEEGCFKGLRAPVPPKSLFDSKIIDRSTYDLLEQSKQTPKEVSKNTSVNKYLQGSESIGGVYLEPTKEKVSIYQAMKKKFLRQNTGIALLEAQAATGFIVDPSRNECLTVDDAVKAGLVGPELHEKLLSAEKAVTGYKDPFTGNKISLYQAMEKDLIPKEHAMPLLDAQLASGGIIDPVNSHRIPFETAIQRGYVTKQLASSIAESKCFSDPASDENISYKQLKDKCMTDPDTGLHLLKLSKPQAPTVVEKTYLYSEEQTQSDLSNTQIDLPIEGQGSMSLWDVMNSNLIPEDQRARLLEEYRSGNLTKERMIIIVIEILEQREIIRGGNGQTGSSRRRQITIEDLYNARIIDLETYNQLKKENKTMRDVMEMQSVRQYLFGTGSVAGVVTDSNSKMSIYQAMKREIIQADIAIALLEAQAATGFIVDPVRNEMLTVDEAVRKGVVGPELHDKLLSAERAVTGYKDPYSGKVISLFQAMKKDLVPEDYALRLLEAQTATGGIIDPEYNFHLPTEIATQRGYINKETNEKLSDEVKGFIDPLTNEKVSYSQLLKRCKVDKDGQYLLSLGDKRLLFKGLRKEITIEELLRSKIIDEQTVSKLNEGLLTVDEVSSSLRKYLEGSSCIAGVFVESTKDRLSIYQAMKKNMIRPGTAFELLEAQAATGYIIDPIKNLKLTVNEAVKMGIVGPEFKDKLLSAERAVTGYRDPYTGKTISLFQAMKKGLILRDHGIRLLEAQIATGGIIDPEQSHRLPVEVAYNRGFFDEEMNEILSDPSDDTKGFFDPNTEENLTYLQLMERCIIDPDTGLVLLLLREKKRERKTSSKSSVRKRRVVIVDPDSGKEMSVYEAYRKGLIDHQTYIELSEQECEWEEITMTSSEGVEKSILIDRRSGRQYDVDDAITRGLIDQSSIEQYRSGTLSITEFADMLSGNIGGFRSRSSSFGSTSSYPMSPVPSIKTPATVWNDPTEETGPVAGILDTDSLEKVSVTEAMRRNLVDSITGQRLLEAQACTGGIIDPSTGEKFSVAEATQKGLIDKIMVDRLNLAQKAFHGFEDPRTKAKMSAAQALKKGWLYYEAGQRFLEVQYLTGGLIEPETEGRISVEEAIRKGAIDGRTAQKLRDVSAYTKYLTCPKTKLKISYKDAMDRSMVEEDSGLRLLEASSVSSKGLYSPYNVSGAASASGSRSGSRTGSRSGSRRGSFDATGSGFSMNFSSSSYTSSSYTRRF
ncbi:plectin isoform X1 [Labeo rohita]|uniref:plectin isoform X1 n=1 Tax=Labeo rohita TaxID=84645 RepID=UPI0021E2CD35|nr:plectin isoform X1 [Labeo rohita]